MSFYYVGNSRTEEQTAEMVRLEAAGICIFCPQHLGQDDEQPVFFRARNWTVTPNRYPYRGTSMHLLLVPDEHVTDLVDLSPEAQSDFWVALRWVRDNYSLSHYGMGVRNGECCFTGGTIAHLHV